MIATLTRIDPETRWYEDRGIRFVGIGREYMVMLWPNGWELYIEGRPRYSGDTDNDIDAAIEARDVRRLVRGVENSA